MSMNRDELSSLLTEVASLVDRQEKRLASLQDDLNKLRDELAAHRRATGDLEAELVSRVVASSGDIWAI